jgi:tetratricopeptide (TPR) repeat protein
LASSYLERGTVFEARGDVALALGEYSHALAVDPSLGEAYLKLGALRERMGDPREAELVYTAATALSAARAQALFARAMLRKHAARTSEALADLETSSELDPAHDTLIELGALYTELRAWPAALAVYRRLLYDAERLGDTHASNETRLEVRALRVLAGETDASKEHGSPHDWVRLALSSIAKR